MHTKPLGFISSLKLVLTELAKIASEASGPHLRCYPRCAAIWEITCSSPAVTFFYISLSCRDSLSPGKGSFPAYTLNLHFFVVGFV